MSGVWANNEEEARSWCVLVDLLSSTGSSVVLKSPASIRGASSGRASWRVSQKSTLATLSLAEAAVVAAGASPHLGDSELPSFVLVAVGASPLLGDSELPSSVPVVPSAGVGASLAAVPAAVPAEGGAGVVVAADVAVVDVSAFVPAGFSVEVVVTSSAAPCVVAGAQPGVAAAALIAVGVVRAAPAPLVDRVGAPSAVAASVVGVDRVAATSHGVASRRVYVVETWAVVLAAVLADVVVLGFGDGVATVSRFVVATSCAAPAVVGDAVVAVGALAVATSAVAVLRDGP
ncbi:hypothetical protein CBR_g45803 [Chara braunii]|uniref:Uncharacterized protein n=1 Tax=Chara braunii TaxID=69332 RepID=A0A388LZ94_CHABU|nr:hypothetical protein CBR_g45803 [Chara braunii]|eukprot:GBG87650.1 hypothetical protein CBR_g45803 [Chara braunii]